MWQGWQTERKPSARHHMAQLEADNVDLLARARVAEAAAAAESAAADALRRENLELAAELAEAAERGHAAADATQRLQDQLAALQRSAEAPQFQAMQPEPAPDQAPAVLLDPAYEQIFQAQVAQPELAAALSGADGEAAAADGYETPELAESDSPQRLTPLQSGELAGEEVHTLTERCLALEAENERLQAQVPRPPQPPAGVGKAHP